MDLGRARRDRGTPKKDRGTFDPHQTPAHRGRRRLWPPGASIFGRICRGHASLVPECNRRRTGRSDPNALPWTCARTARGRVVRGLVRPVREVQDSEHTDGETRDPSPRCAPPVVYSPSSRTDLRRALQGEGGSRLFSFSTLESWTSRTSRTSPRPARPLKVQHSAI